jgi:hypothetical protein
MIDAGPSLRAAEGLTGSAFAAYLLQKNWPARPSRVEGISIFSKLFEGAEQPVEFILPVVPGFTDERLRIADALRTVAAVEDRSVDAVADEIRQVANATAK